jgi:hypothetical protein
MFPIHLPRFQSPSRFSEDPSRFSRWKASQEDQGQMKSTHRDREQFKQNLSMPRQNYYLERCSFL